MDRNELLALYDKEMRIEIEVPGVRKEKFPDIVRFIRPAPGMNYVSYSRLDGNQLDTAVQVQIDFFSRMDQPFSWHVCDHDAPPGLMARLLAYGFAPDDDPDAVMVLDLHEAPTTLLEAAGDSARRIERQEQLDDVARIEESVWGGDFSWLVGRLGPHLGIPGYLSVYLAYWEGQPACSGWIYFHPHSQFAGLFGGSTLVEHRNRGLYTSILAVRAQEAAKRGCRFLVTGASPMSQPILAKNGFRLLTYSHSMVWKDEGGQPLP